MRKLLWWALAVVLVLPVVLACLLVIMPFTLLKWPAATAISAALDRKVTIEGPIDFDLFAPTRLAAAGVSVANADWAGDQPFLAVGKVALELDTAKLGDGVLVVRQLSLEAPEINLTRNDAGDWNWPSLGKPRPEPTDGHPRPEAPSKWRFLVERLDVKGGSLTYKEPGNDRSRRFAPIDLDVARAKDGKALDVKGRVVGTTGPAGIEGRVDDMTALEAGESSPLRLSLKAPGGHLEVEGRIGGETPLDLRLAAHADEPGTLARWAGDAVAKPKEMLKAIDFKTGLVGDFKALALRDLDLKMGELAVKGDLALDITKRPRVTGALDLGRLELPASRASDASSGAGGSGTSGSGTSWPTDSIDWPVPLPLDLDLNLAYARLGLGKFALNDGTGHLYGDSLITQLRLASADALGGALDVEASLRREGEGPPKLALVANGKGLGLGPLLAAFKSGGLEGKADFALDVAATGASVDEVVRGLNGTARLETADARIGDPGAAGALGAALGLLGGSDDAPIKLASGFGIENGVAHTDGLAGTLAGLAAKGDGMIDLPERRLDIRLDPTPAKGSPLNGLDSVGLRVEGPWRDLAWRVAVDGATSGDLRDPKTAAGFVAGLVAKGTLGQGAGGADGVGDALAKSLGGEAARQLGDHLGQALGAGAGPLVDHLLGSGQR